MAHFAVTMNDKTTYFVDGADAYQQEGPLTTFFSFSGDRHVIDSWSIRLASYRTADISAIRREQQVRHLHDTASAEVLAKSGVIGKRDQVDDCGNRCGLHLGETALPLTDG